MRVLVLGGDGYCGWPTALSLSASGMSVAIVDNFSRRSIGRQLGVDSLVPIASLPERVDAWREATGAVMQHHDIDIAEDFPALVSMVSAFRPDAVVHFAEQRSVPYSMGSSQGGRYTFRNNFLATSNVLTALVETGIDAHFVQLGSIGVYGYETLGYEVPEGYQAARFILPNGDLGPNVDILHPFHPVSKYHLTKALDHLSVAYFAEAHGVRATILHQGTVWGSETPETSRDRRLANRFDYDTIYGTVLNRFAVQAALGASLSVYGTGGQTRGFIHLEDVLRCVRGALASPPEAGSRAKVVNQVAETMRIEDLAELFSRVSNSQIVHLPSPRDEPTANELIAINARMRAFSVTPKMISEATVSELVDTVRARTDAVQRAWLYPT